MSYRHGHQHDQRRTLWQCSLTAALALLMLPLLAQAQDLDAATGATDPVTGSLPQQDSAPLASPATPSNPETGSGVESAPLALQAVPAIDYSMPAGVCPVITDYLYQQCQQNPADAMCAPANGTQ